MSSQQQVGLRTLSRQQWEREQRDRLAKQQQERLAAMHFVARSSGAQFLAERAVEVDGR